MIRSANRVALAALVGMSLLAAGGCSQTERAVATGAALGAGGGALVGGATGGSVAGGAVVGGVVGAGVGYCVARDCLR
jgi:hypothetical protein